MTQTAAKRQNAARGLAKTVFQTEGATAHTNHDDLTAAIASIDATMDLQPAGLNSARTVKQNFIDNLPEPFKSNSSAREKAWALVQWALEETR